MNYELNSWYPEEKGHTAPWEESQKVAHISHWNSQTYSKQKSELRARTRREEVAGSKERELRVREGFGTAELGNLRKQSKWLKKRTNLGEVHSLSSESAVLAAAVAWVVEAVPRKDYGWRVSKKFIPFSGKLKWKWKKEFLFQWHSYYWDLSSYRSAASLLSIFYFEILPVLLSTSSSCIIPEIASFRLSFDPKQKGSAYSDRGLLHNLVNSFSLNTDTDRDY